MAAQWLYFLNGTYTRLGYVPPDPFPTVVTPENVAYI
jgi:hypothetical protein